jgi:uncharacterized protein (TIGR02300 family)
LCLWEAEFFENEVPEVAREDLGTKRTCPDTGKKFYDLNKDPVVSPYTGKQYERSVFEVGETVKTKPQETAKKEEVAATEETEDTVEAEEGAPEFISTEEIDEDSDDDVDGDDEEIPDIPDVEIEVDDDDESDDDAFLDDEDEDDDLSNVIGGVDGEEEV